MTKQTKMALAMIGVFSVAMDVQGGAVYAASNGIVYAASNGINGMSKIPLTSLRQILPVNHSCVHYCELKAVEICNILNHKGVQKKKCTDKSFDLCLSMLRYGDC